MPKLDVTTQQKTLTAPEPKTIVEAQDQVNNEFWELKNTIQAKHDFEGRISEKLQEKQGDPAGFTPEMLSEFDDYSGEVLKQAPDKVSRDRLSTNLSNYRQSLGQTSVGLEASATQQKRRDDALGMKDVAISRVSNNPDLVEDAMTDMESVSQFLPLDERDTFVNDYKTQVSSAAVRKIIADDPDRGMKELKNGFAKNLDKQEKEVLMKEAEIQRNKDLAASDKAVLDTENSIDSALEKTSSFEPVPEEDINSIKQLASTSGDPALIKRAEEMERVVKENELLQSLPLEEARKVANESKDERQVKFIDEIQREATQNPLTYEAKIGNIELADIAIDEPSTMIKRVKDAKYAAQKNGAALQVLTPEEANGLAEQVKAMDVDKAIEFADKLTNGFGSMSGDVVNQMAQTAPLEAQAIGLYSYHQAGKTAARNILQGKKMFTEKPGLKEQIFKDRINVKTFDALAGSALFENEVAGNNIRQSADAIYATMLENAGSQTFDPRMYQEAIRKASGGTDDPRTGIRQINGIDTILPPGVPDDDFEKFVSLLPDDLANYGTFTHLGGNMYAVKVNGRDVMELNITAEDIGVAVAEKLSPEEFAQEEQQQIQRDLELGFF